MLAWKFEEQVKNTPGNIAVKDDPAIYTYKELNRYANRIAHLVSSAQSGEIIGLLFDHGVHMIAAILGALKAGKIVVPLSVDYPLERLSYMLSDSQSSLILTNTPNRSSALQLAGKNNIPVLEIDAADSHDTGDGDWDENPVRTVSGDKPAYILYTSGSTGKPRGVGQTHENADYYNRNWVRVFSITSSDRMTLFSSFCHDGSVQDMYSALHSGAALYPFSMKKRNTSIELSEFLVREKITIWHSVPSLFSSFASTLTGDEKFPDLRFILLGGEPVREHEVLVLNKYFSPSTLANIYGQTESSVNSICIIPAGTRYKKPLIGTPLDETQIFVIDEEGDPVRPLQTGEILVACRHISPGYWRNPEATARVFAQDEQLGRLYWTGDLGRLLVDGNIEFLGRRDLQVKIRGFRIELGEIESRLLEHPSVKEAAVTLRQDKTNDHYLCAYVLTRQADETGLRKYLSRYLPDYMVPSYIVGLEQMPRTPSGKIDRNALPAPKIQRTPQNYVPPGNDIEKKLVKIWSDVLGAAEELIGIDDDFFQLGGHSLKATIMTAKLQQQLGAKVPLAAVFKTPSIRELATHVRAALETGKSTDESIETVEKKEYYPLSSAQRRLYILQQMELGHTGYNLPIITILEGNLHKERFEQAFKRLIARHESLRTSFHLLDEEPVQKIWAQVEFEIEYFELATENTESAINACGEDNQSAAALISSFIRPFDLTKAPLLRVGLLTLHTPPCGHPRRGAYISQQGKEQKHILMVDMHHIITDGTSMGIITNEFMSLYAGKELEPLTHHYKDYSQWQRQYNRGESIKKQETYWLNRLAGEIPRLDLAFDYPRPLRRSFAGNLLTFTIGEDLTKALRALALSRETTLFMILFAIYNVLLAKLSGQEDIIVGIPSAGRPHADLQQIIGMFVNTLTLRSAPIGEKSFKRFLKEVKQRTIEAYQNQAYQFEELVEKLTASIKRDAGGNPLFDVLFVLQNMETPQGEIPGLKLKPYEYEMGRARFDLSLSVYESKHTLTLVMEYSTQLFKKETIQEFFNYFKTIGFLVMKTPGMKIKDIEMISPRHKRQLLYDFNDTRREYPIGKTIHQLFEEQVNSNPDRTALIGTVQEPRGRGMLFEETKGLAPWSTITYSELNERAQRLANVLSQKGAGPDTIVGIMLERSPQIIIGILAILKAGSAYMPIAPEYPEERIKYMLKDSKVKILINNSKYFNKSFFQEKIELIHINEHINKTCPKGASFHLHLQPAPATSLAYLIYTSGSTGRPKGIMIEHENVAGRVINTNFIEAGKDDRLLLTGAIVFDITTFEIWWPLLQAKPLVLADKNLFADPGRLEQVILTNKITVLHLIPQLFDQLARQNDKIFAALNYFLVGGDLVKPLYINLIRNKYPHLQILHMYGPTENTTFSTFLPVNREYTASIPIGRPVSNCFVYILDKFLHLQPGGVAGELCVGGVGTARGYLNDPELTARKFLVSDLSDKSNKSNRSYKSYIIYLTGDLGRWLPEGSIEFLGRSDHQVKIRGHRIEMEGIESRLVNHPMIKQAVVILRENAGNDGDRHLCAYIVPITPGRELDTGEIKKYLSQALPGYMIPSFFVPIEEIPLTVSGKTDRKALPRPAVKIGENYAPPGSEIEKKLVQIWSGILGIEKERIGIHDNFFHLGGHSLKATLLTAKIHQVYDIFIPLAEVFRTSTIRALADYIAKHAGSEQESYVSINPIEKKDYYPLSSAQKRLYFIQHMDINSIAYNTPIVLYFREEMEKNKIENAIKKLLTRHESLRTSFAAVKEEPAQRIHQEQDIDFSMEYYESDETGAKEILRNFIRPFELTEAPLIRSGVVTLPGGNHLWLADMHHIISDGTSLTIITEDFISLYKGEELEPLLLHYKDFSTWQNNLFAKGKIKNQEDYWKRLYSAGEVPGLQMCEDYKRPEVFTFAGDIYHFKLSREEVKKFNALGAGNGATLYMNVLALLNTLFYKYSGQTDIVIGGTIAGRRSVDLQRIAGMFVNSLAMRNYPDGGKSYDTFLKEVAANSIEAFENQDVQFEELVDKLDLPRDPARNPLFDICMVVQNFRDRRTSGQQEESKANHPAVQYENTTTKFDMTFFVIEKEDEIIIRIEYYTGVFREETIKRLAMHFKNMLNAVSAQPSIKIKDIDILSPEEKNQVLYEFNVTRGEYPRHKTIHGLFADQAAMTPDHTALLGNDEGEKGRRGEGKREEAPFGQILNVCGEIQLSYSILDEQSNQLANYLTGEKNIGPGHLVGILMDNSIELVIALLGVLKAGGAYVPMEPALPPERIGFIIRDTSMGMIISSKKYINVLDRLQWENPCFHTYLCMDSPDIYKEEEAEPSQLMDKELWHHIGESAQDEIEGGGWISSYTGEKFSRREMDEYGDNILKKLQPLLHKKMRVLEIGTASGITMFRLAPGVGFYYGTDLSAVIIEKNKKRAAQEGHQNIKLTCLPAHQIQQIGEKDFDLIIINSVIHCFPGLRYLRKVIETLIPRLGPKGYLFIGDIMDQDMKANLIRDLREYKQTCNTKNSQTKTDWSHELFVSRGYFEDLGADLPFIASMEFSRKIYTLENELTKFRYDALFFINKEVPPPKTRKQKQKYQEDLRVLDRYAADRPAATSKPGDIAYIIYTSGTTGKPKGVMIRHQSLVNYIHWASRQYVGKKAMQLAFPLYTNVSFDLTVTSIYVPLTTGNRIVVYEQDRNRPAIIDVANENKVDVIKATPSHLKILKDEITSANRRIKRFIVGGEELETQLARQVAHRFNRDIEIFNEYGPTEATVGCMIYRFDAQKDNRTGVPVGKPIANARIYILAGDLSPVPPGARGEIYIAGDVLARGYLNNPELTGEKFDHDLLDLWDYRDRYHRSYRSHKSYILYRTGDLARFLPDGNIEFLGRKDKQVKVRGYRIELKEIENQVLEHDSIKETVVICRQDKNDPWGTGTPGDLYTCCYWVPKQKENPPETAEIKEYLTRRLPAYMVPDYLVKLEKIPLTPNGKVDEKALPGPGANEKDKNYMAPGNRIEKKLAEIWSGVLRVDKGIIGTNTNFFQIGGHSLKATVLVSRIHKEMNVKIPLAEIFKTPTIKELSGFILRADRDKYETLRPTEKKEYYALSSGQKRLYFIQQMDPGSTGYNMPYFIPLTRGLEKSKVETTLKKLVARHEILRTSFPLVGTEPVQKIHDADEIKLSVQYYDMSSEFIRPFDLPRAPLLRMGYTESASSEHLLMIDLHHIISDGISQNILEQEFFSLYRGEEQELPKLKLQYKDYTQWLSHIKQRALIKTQQEYWLNVFAEEVPVLELPYDFPRPQMQSFAGKRVDFILNEKETALLKNTARENNITLYMLLLAIFNILYSKLSGQEDIIIGTPIAARRHEDLQQIVGMMVNTLAMRNYPGAGKTGKQFLQEIKQQTLAAYENQEYPFEELVEKVPVRRDTGRNPIFDVMLNLLNQWEYPGKISDNGTINGTQPEHSSAPAPFDMVFNVIQLEKHILFMFEYCTKLFKQETAERFISYLKHLVSGLPGNIHQELREIDIISAEEKKKILQMSQGEQEFLADKEKQVMHRLFEQAAGENPGSTALVYEEQHLGYEELNRQANQWANLLRQKGIGPGNLVAMMMERSPEMITAILAIIKAGAAVLPIDPAYPRERVLTMLNDSNTPLLLTRSNLQQQFPITALTGMTPYEEKHLVITPGQAPIKDFDRHPFPDRTLVEYGKYHQYIGIGMARHTVTLQATRGCPFNCAFCHKIWPKKHIVRQAENIFQEMQICYRAGIRRFVFIDDIFNLDAKNSTRLLETIIRQQMGIQLFFPNGLRGDLLDKEFIDMMIEAGTVNIDLALESASPRIQKLIGKHLHLEKFQDNVRYIIKKYPQLMLEMELMIGFPTETEAEAEMTLAFLKDLEWVHFPNINILKIYPNTDMYRLAVKNGVSPKAIQQSVGLTYHQLPETLPYAKEFVKEYQARYLNEYFLSKQRLRQVLPYQTRHLTREEIVMKYDSYLPAPIKDFTQILELADITREELKEIRFLPPDYHAAPGFTAAVKNDYPAQKKAADALRILLVDVSLLFSTHSQHLLYDMVDEPLGLMYLLTYLNKRLGPRIRGKILKSRIDFDSYPQLKEIIAEFKPDLIGLRTLSCYKDFFHQTVLLIRQWGIRAPIIAGGPYATSDFTYLLRDNNIDLAVLGEGEIILGNLLEKMLENHKKLPGPDILKTIPGLAFVNKEAGIREKAASREIILLDEIASRLNQYPPENLENRNQPGDLFYVLYTSGSTGKPKGVMLEHGNMANLIIWGLQKTNLDFSSVLQYATICFDASFHEIFSALTAGGKLCLIPERARTELAELFKIIERNQVKTLFLPMALLKVIFSEEDYIRMFPRCVRHIQTAGEQVVVSRRFRTYLQENNIHLHNHYGPTEAHVVTALTMAPTNAIPTLPSIGRPVTNTGIYILDKYKNIQPLGVPGELYIGGIQVGRGYLNLPQLTRERFVNCKHHYFYRSHKSYKSYILYRSGDLARWQPDGNIEFLGRIDHQVKIRGFRIEPGEIENCLQKKPGIKNALVLAKQDENRDKYLCVYIVTDRDSKPDRSALRQYLEKHLPDYMVPAYFIPIDKIPMTPSGKIDRKSLPTPGLETGTRYASPGDEVERKLVEIWSELLGIERGAISIDANFFELGGHSLKATILTTKIHKELNVRVPVAEVFKHRTIRSLAGYARNRTPERYAGIDPVEKREYYELSSAQKRLYFLQQMDHNSTAYNMPLLLPLGKEVDKAGLESTLKKLIARHENLRTSIKQVNEQPVQRLHDQVKFEIEYNRSLVNCHWSLVNCQGRGEVSSPIMVEKIIRDFIRPFDLSQAPLMRSGLIGHADGHHTWIVDIHHIISDGTSQTILNQDFLALHSGKELEPLRIHYKDFSGWQNRLLRSGAIKAQENYWLSLYRDIKEIPRLQIPVDFKRPAVFTFAGADYKFILEREEARQFKSLGATHGATLYMNILAALNTLFYKYTRQTDIIIGTGIAGRPHIDLQNIIGMFVNTLAIRNYPGAQKTYESFLAEVRENSINAFENQDVQFDELVDRLAPERDLSRNPLFDISMVVQHSRQETSRREQLSKKNENLRQEEILPLATAKFDMTFFLHESGDDVYIKIEYYTGIFKKETLHRLANHFKQIVKTVILQPRVRLKDIEIMTEEEKEEVLETFNDTARDYPRGKIIPQLFEEQVERTPDNIALVYKNEEMTYRELEAGTNRIAGYLYYEKEVAPGREKPVGLLLGPSLHRPLAFLAILKAGGVYVPLDPQLPQERIKFMIEDAGIGTVISGKSHINRLDSLQWECQALHTYLCVDSDSIHAQDDDFNIKNRNSKHREDLRNIAKYGPGKVPCAAKPDPGNLAYIIYTSGSTGKPKGVLLEHRGIANLEMVFMNQLNIDNRDKIIQFANLSFDASIWEVLMALLNGAELHLLPKKIINDYGLFHDYLNRHLVTIATLPPIYANHLQIEELSHLRLLITAGSSPNFNFVQRCKDSGSFDYINAYGPTEDTICSSYCQFGKNEDINVITIGGPLANKRYYIVNNENMSPQPVGVPGELCVTGPGLARGYLNQPELTTQRFLPFNIGNNRSHRTHKSYRSDKSYIYRTGDLARWLSNGTVEYWGREDRQVKVRGNRIELAEIENRLLTHKKIKEAVVTARENQTGEKYLCAYVVPAKAAAAHETLSSQEIREYLSHTSPDYMIPGRFVILEQLPLGPAGKIDHRALPDPNESSWDSQIQYTAPGNMIEKILAQVWESVLGKKKIGIHEDFFLIGGDSIKAIQLASRVNKQGYKIEIRDIFLNPTISKLAPGVKKLEYTAPQAPVTGSVPLTPIQERFFREPKHVPHHYNQALMFYSAVGFDKTALAAVFAHLQTHHDALRMTYKRSENGTVQQTGRGTDYPLSLREYDLKGQKHTPRLLETRANEIQAGIDLETGPLMKLGLFHLEDGDRLLVVIHHLVIDGVSWRILYEDIETLYRQYKNGEPLQLPLKTDSYQRWAEKLREYADSKVFLKEIPYWTRLEARHPHIPVIKRDMPNGANHNLIKYTHKQTFRLTEQETEQLLTTVNNAFGTEINDILLTAVGLAVKRTYGHERVLIGLEGHGREEILPPVDISRTLGWFTTIYPVLLDMSHENCPARQIKEVKESLRQVPHKGIGYGILRYLTSGPDRQKINFQLNPQIFFNYLGQLDMEVGEMSFQAAEESPGQLHSPEEQNESEFGIIGMIANNRLAMSITYNKLFYRPETIETLMNHYQEELRTIISFCSAREQREPTPSDFTYKKLSIDELEAITSDPGREMIEDIYPLSPMQEGMLYHWLLEKDLPDASVTYFEQMSYRLQGELDIPLLEKSLNQLVNRHEILRVVFIHENPNQPVQLVLKERNIDFYYGDIRHLVTPGEKEDFIKEFKERDKQRGFDLRKDVLMRVSVLQTADRQYEFTWSFHHILMDGWCIGILNSEFFEIYNANLQERPCQLPPVQSYRTYIHWLQQWDKDAAKDYWSGHLEAYENAAQIPRATAVKKEMQGYKNELYSLELEKEKTTGLNALAVRNRVTLNTIMQTLWGVILGIYNRQQDVVFGAVVSGRPPGIEGVETMVGLFINTVPVRIRWEEKQTFTDLARDVRDKAVASEPHHYYPLAEILAVSPLKQNLLDHIFIFENYPIAPQLQKENNSQDKQDKNQKSPLTLKVDHIDVFEQTNYDFNLTLVPGDQIRINLSYNAEVYEPVFIQQVANHIERAADQVLVKEDILITDITLLSEQEKQQALYEFNRAAADYPADKTLHRLFMEQVERTPGNIALSGTNLELRHEIQLTYRELHEKTRQLAHRLAGMGVKPETTAAIMIERSLEMIIGILGILKAGGAYLPIDPDYPGERIDYMLKDSGAKILLTSDAINRVPTPQRLSFHPSTLPPFFPSNPSNLAYIIYTSGTTGKPRGVMIQHKNVVSLLCNDGFQFDFYPNDIWMLFHSFCFDFSVWEMYGALLYGAKLVLIPKKVSQDTAGVLEILKTQQVTVLNQTPTAFYYLAVEELNHPDRQLNLKYVIFGGEALTPAKLTQWKLKYPAAKLINMFGITETTVHVTYKEIKDEEIRLNTSNIGNPIATLHTYVMDSHLKLLPPGIAGECCVTGPGLARGYLNRPGLTKEKFVENPYKPGEPMYRSGDLVRCLDNGELEYLGRIDQQVKIRGFRIELGEIETRLLTHPLIKEAAVIDLDTDKGEKYLCAYIVSTESIDVSKIKDFLAGVLPGYMIPAAVVTLDKMPLTASGKLARKTLPLPGFIRAHQYEAPGTGIEKKLVAIWSEILHIDTNKIGIHDNFFDLGGHSLKATLLINKIYKTFNIELPLKEIFETPTIKVIAAIIETLRETGNEQDVTQEEKESEEIIL